MPSPNSSGGDRRDWASRGEVLAWAFFDFANSGYVTVVITALFNMYFVRVVAASADWAALLWTGALSVANALVLLLGPWVGQSADESGRLKPWLAVSTTVCVLGTASLATVGPGDHLWGAGVVIVATLGFGLSENLIAAFLPRLVPPERLGRTSALGWGIGYLGGMLTLALCLAYVAWSRARGGEMTDFVPGAMLIVAGVFALAAMPTFLSVRERPAAWEERAYHTSPWQRMIQAWRDVRQLPDLSRFLICLGIYYCGIQTVVALAAVYADQAMGFTTQQILGMILVLNLAAAAGAFALGPVHDRLGAVRTVALTLVAWVAALVTAHLAHSPLLFWMAATLVGLCIGASQSSGRALVALLSPAGHEGAFFGLWGVAVKLAAIVGPPVYGLLTFLSGGDYRTALLVTAGFFLVGLVLLRGVNVARGVTARQRFQEEAPGAE
ncbi:MFS transporter [Thiohalorhabdus sp.]|uniref:MFS transporter n=1 Tax=Thiohalorhabdus sp. TaxID=3094134 RepID=UPI002FC30840